MSIPVVERTGNASAAGIAKEAVFGTPVLATSFEPMSDLSIVPDPGLFYPQVMMGVRDASVWPLYGQTKLQGALAGPLFPVNGIHMWVGAVGTDNVQSGTLASPIGTGTVTAAAAGATTLAYTVTGATAAPAAGGGEYYQIGPAIATLAVPALATAGTQVVKSTSYGTGTLTVPALQYKVDSVLNGGAGLVIQRVVAPFYHNVLPSNSALNSYTIEKNLANYQSEQYAGCRVDKFSLKLPSTNAEVSFTADLFAKAVAILDTPTAVTVDQAAPYVFSEGAVNFNGKALVQATNIEFTLENTVKDTFTITNSTLPTFLTPTTRKITGKCTMIWVSNDDTDWGYFKKMIPSLASGGTPFQADLNVTLTHPLGAGIFYIDFPQVNFAKVGDEIKIGDVIMQTFDFQAAYSIASSTVLSSYFANSAWAAY
jgi:hypothetical protein